MISTLFLALALAAPADARTAGLEPPATRTSAAISASASRAAASLGLPESGIADRAGPRPLGQAQASQDWNDPAVLALVARGREARRDLAAGGDLETYQALTEGHIYFFVDPEEGERSLIRVDQVAVELRWSAPDRVHQRVIGERSERRLPVREFRYYLDRLTLVQYGFGDEIQVGSGMDVAGVPHPLAPLPGNDPARGPYDFRISDSLALRLPGQPEPIQLQEVQVRPRDLDAPGVMGTLLLDRRTGSIVRMKFGFTPASYVDRRTDQISVEVDYGLWEGRYWLPNRQEIEVRRELPELDLEVGTVIRAVLRVSDYQLNVPFPADFVRFSQVTWMTEEVRRAYAFSEGLLDGLERHGLGSVETRADPRELRTQAVELLRNRPPSGLSPLRLHLPGASSAIRYNRAEGLFLGMGGSLRPAANLRLRGHGGYATGMKRPSASFEADGIRGEGLGWKLEGAVNEVGDLGLVPGSDPLLSSLGAVVLGEDYLDPFRSSRLEASLTSQGGGPWRLRASAGVRQDRSLERSAQSAPLDGTRDFRPVRPVSRGDFLSAGLEGRREVPWPRDGSGSARLSVHGLFGDPGSGAEARAELRGRWGDPMGMREIEARFLGRSWLGDPIAQGHRLLGGRGSVPGYDFRAWAGRDLALGSVEAATDLHGPLVRLRGGLHAGWAGRGAADVLSTWATGGTGGVRPAVTLGLGLGWDILRIETARGLRGGEWQLILSVDPRWWDRL